MIKKDDLQDSLVLRENSGIREDILETLDKLFPDDVIEMWGGIEESYLEDIYEELRDKLSAIETASLDYERDWQGSDPRYDNDGEFPEWHYEEEDPDEPPDMGDIDSSYHVFFLGLKEERFRYETESEIPDEEEEDRWVKIDGIGTFGCCVGISLLAPFAVVVPVDMEHYENGSHSYPDIHPYIFDLRGKPIDMEKHIREMIEEEGVQAVRELADRIVSILDSFGIAILPAEEAEKPVPWLKPGEGVIIKPPGKTITLKDALFFRGMF